ncbi:VTT domain-containing protein [Blastococcus sp. BMG 814]|uniref:TVP38/TMEM64 family membrane protein n=1 Tax=Blastococcus carthaginiensis TaxID=3050034 RepID=A0ABT9IEZ5_9ACTN|nr:VTT domain-containing protein [Blastococcus carthaginiensis]MDP5184161.1 VTT domain-containing protein [Blastococcus carthaginiensis]
MRTAVDRAWLRAAVLGALLLGGGVAALTLDLPSADHLRAVVDGAGAVAWPLLVGAVALVLLAPVPRSVVSALVGAVLGFAAGLAVAFVGGMLAAVVAFGLARALGRPAVARLAGPRLGRLAGGRTFAAVLVSRLVPVVPFVAVNYGAGLAGVRPAPFAAATAVGLVPSTLVQVGLGASAGVLFAHLDAAVVVAGLVAGLAVLAVGTAWWYRGRTARPARGGA